MPFKVNRDDVIDRMKGILIALMVIGHALSFSSCVVRAFIYLFHIGVFIVLSGWFVNVDKCRNVREFGNIVMKKVVRLWWPFFFFQTVFILLNNFFISIQFYNLSPKLALEAGSGIGVHEVYSWIKVLKQIVLTFIMMPITTMGGGMWYLQTIFWCSIAYFTFALLFRVTRINMLFGQSIIAIVCLILSSFRVDIPYLGFFGGLRLLTCYFLLHFGVILRSKIGIRDDVMDGRRGLLVFTFSVAVLIMLLPFEKVDLIDNRFCHSYTLVLAILAGFMLVRYLSVQIGKVKILGDSLAIVGRRSMSVLILHFLCFKFVTLSYLLLTGGNMQLCAAFPVLEGHNVLLVLYVIVGIFIPVASSVIYDRLKAQLRR